MKCKISAWGCVYHACMSDDCQLHEVLKYEGWGPGKCMTLNNHNMKDVINHSSVDDVRSSLRNINPASLKELNGILPYLKRSLQDELSDQNRPSMVKMLNAKINRLEKQKMKFLKIN